MDETILQALIVDLDADVRRAIALELVKHGFACEELADGQQALDRARAKKFDVVITELILPNLNGHALLAALLAADDRPLLIAYTGIAEPRLLRDLFARGIDDVLFKPMDYGLLAVKIRVLVERKRGKAELESPGHVAKPADNA